MQQPKSQLTIHIIQILMLLTGVILLGLPAFCTKTLSLEALIVQILIVGVMFIKAWALIKPQTADLFLNFKQADLLSSDVVLNSLSDGIIVIDRNNMIKFFNKSAVLITGFQPEDVLGMNYDLILKFVNNENAPILPADDPIFATRNTFTANQHDLLYLKTRGQKTKPISLQVTPISDNSSDILIAFRDISRELDKEREQMEFISTASHEMRTPIATINGYLGLALNPKISQVDDKAQEYITKAQAAVEHLGELFKNLLSISKAEDKQMTITPKVINLTQFGEEICNDFQSQAASKNIHLVFKPSGSRSKILQPDILVHTDKNLLYEVISNLLENAIKYTQQGTITVDVGIKNQDFAIISVTDTGIGIPPEDIPHLFQKFYRVDNSQTREIGGTGLGLYLCRKIVENLHGRIWAESSLSQGSTFFVELKRINQAQATKLNASDQLQQAANQQVFTDHRQNLN